MPKKAHNYDHVVDAKETYLFLITPIVHLIFMRLFTLYNAVSLLAFIPRSTFAAVLAIDYGTDWIKASVMSPGLPFDVLLNKDSKRKIQSSVGWKRKDRLFGTDAFALVRRSYLSICEA